MSKIYYKEYGGGYPLIFLHGFCETNYVWEGVAELLKNDFRIICPDIPGFGKSLPMPNGFTLDDVASELYNGLTNDLKIDNGFVIGHSLGGYITLAFARMFPDFCNGFCLFNSSVFEDSEDKKENRNKLIEHLRENGVTSFIRTFVPSLFYSDRVADFENVIVKIRDEGLKLSPDVVAGYAAAMRDRKSGVETIKKYKENVLVIAGEEDNNVPKEVSLKISTFINSSNFYLLPASAHMSMFEQKVRSAEIIRDFVTKQVVA